jgi:hypothetical protein
VRISATQIESFRLWRDPEQEWMTEESLIDTIKGVFVPNHKINLGSAFGKVLEDPDRYMVPGGFRRKAGGEWFEFGRDVIEPCLALIDRRGIFEAKAIAHYDDGIDVVSKADHLYGAHLSEFKTTLGQFDFDKYAESCQWRFMADAFQPRRITYRVFCLDEATNGVISLKDIHSFDLYPYQGLRDDCARLVREFAAYVTAKGLDGLLRERQAAA